MDKVSNMLPNSWQNVSWESDNYVEGPTQDTMFNLLIFSQIHPAVHISLRLLHRTLPQEGAGMLVFCLTCDLRVFVHITMFIFQFEYQQAQLEAEIENLSWKVNIYMHFLLVYFVFLYFIFVYLSLAAFGVKIFSICHSRWNMQRQQTEATWKISKLLIFII